MCRRKKDHGRAEALLLLAWAMGIRVQTQSHKQNPPEKTNESLAQETVAQVEHDVAPLILPAKSVASQ